MHVEVIDQIFLFSHSEIPTSFHAETSTTMFALAASLLCIWIVSKTLYRLFFHPLSHIPGPKLAAASHALEFYHDVIRGGMYIWEIERMHEKYG